MASSGDPIALIKEFPQHWRKQYVLKYYLDFSFGIIPKRVLFHSVGPGKAMRACPTSGPLDRLPGNGQLNYIYLSQ